MEIKTKFYILQKLVLLHDTISDEIAKLKFGHSINLPFSKKLLFNLLFLLLLKFPPLRKAPQSIRIESVYQMMFDV